MSDAVRPASQPWRLGIVDDHSVVALGITAALRVREDLDVLGQSATVDGLLAAARRFDLVLLDLRLADDSTPTSNIERLHSVGAKVLVYSSGDSLTLVREAAQAGAVGFVRKSETLDVLVSAVRHALAGEVVASFEWANAIETDPRLPESILTSREREVLGRYASGETAETVAAALSISPHTVLDHIKRIRVRYAGQGRPAPTKSHLLQRAIEDGLVENP